MKRKKRKPRYVWIETHSAWCKKSTAMRWIDFPMWLFPANTIVYHEHANGPSRAWDTIYYTTPTRSITLPAPEPLNLARCSMCLNHYSYCECKNASPTSLTN